jgi:hypothetical protein
MPNTPLILGLTSQNCAVPFLVDESGKPPGGDGEVICLASCAVGGKAYLGNGTQVLTLMDFSGLAIANTLELYTWSTENPPALDLTNRIWFGRYDFGDDVTIAFTKARRYFSVFAINPATSFYDGCCFQVENGFIKILGF